jgi:hypothetical protein
MSLEIRAVIHLFWLKNLPNSEISHKIESIYWAGVIGLRDIQKWTHRFEDGELSLEDEPRINRLRSTEHIDAIHALLADDPHLSQKRIACILSIHQNTVKCVLCENREDLWFQKVNFKWILHLLDDNQKLERIRLSTEFLEFVESKSERPLVNIYTGCKTWIHYNNTRSSMKVYMDFARLTRI